MSIGDDMTMSIPGKRAAMGVDVYEVDGLVVMVR